LHPFCNCFIEVYIEHLFLLLQGVHGSLDQREDLDELRAAAEPLASSSDPEVSQKIEAAVAEAVTAWNDIRHSLLELCNQYQEAVRLWKQYQEASEAIKAWADQQLDTVAQFKPEEALRQVKVCSCFPNH
jgi:prophage DNA circulation protein